jgi:ABC-2 type transport system ATP-binding protein
VSILGHSAGSAEAVRSLGIVPQEIALYEVLSARRNLELFGSLRGITGNQLAERVKSALTVVGLDEHQHRRVKTFSGGMKRRLNLAIGLLHDPPVLLLDEPTVGVDPQSRARIFALLKDLHAAGKTIIYTTHYMEEAERLCQKIGIIDRGRLLAEGTLFDLFSMVTTPRSVRLYLAGGKDAAVPLEGTEMAGDTEHVDYVPGSADRLGQIVAEIERTGMNYERMEIVGPNLESLFLQLTGKELRD